MTQDDLFAFLRTEAQRIGQIVPGAVWYLFGSALRTLEHAKDIDIVVLCGNKDAVATVRQELADACVRFPLHLCLLTSDEEAELGFIGAEGCVQLYPVDEN
jgi:hypothetical protein